MRATSWLLAAGLVAAGVPARGRTIVVGPGDSIQAAVDLASPGDTVAVRPGTYHEAGRPCPTEPATCAVVLTQDDVSLLALSGDAPVVLENSGGQQQGIAIARAGATGPDCLTDTSQRVDGALVQGFTVNGFDGDGIFLFCVDRWAVLGNATHDDAEYGIFPSHCGSGEVAHNVATGANDTGIYVGQSHDVRIHHNLATGNVSGFELENSSHSRVDHNESTGNTGGILTFTNIFLDVKQNADNRVDHNFVHDNNRPNSCLNPLDEVCAVPQGTGLLVLAADRNQVDHNVVTGNDSFGIAVANFCVGNMLTDEQCAALDIEPNSDFTRVLFNVATGNGTNPSPLINPVFAVDLAWDTTGTGNCWSHNAAGTQFPPELPSCPVGH
jgi:parallel beta-helix repeat protein